MIPGIGHRLLNCIPDFLEWDETKRWISKSQKIVRKCTEKEILEGEIYSLEWLQIAEKREMPFGLYQSKVWRKFVLSTFFADLVSYSQPEQQVDFARLLYVMHAFPKGFRTWWMNLRKGLCLPVGYTGFYPMLDSTFEIFKKKPDQLKDRMVVPNTDLHSGRSYVYLFNFSVAPEFKFEYFTKLFMKRFVDDIQTQNAKGLACIAVAEDGARIARRFDMAYSGEFFVNGFSEKVFTSQSSKEVCKVFQNHL